MPTQSFFFSEMNFYSRPLYELSSVRNINDPEGLYASTINENGKYYAEQLKLVLSDAAEQAFRAVERYPEEDSSDSNTEFMIRQSLYKRNVR